LRRLFLLVAATVLVDTMFYAAIAPLLPTYEADLGLSKTSAGILSASYPAGTLLASLPAGWLAGRFGAKRTMMGGLGLLTGSSLAFGLANEIVALDAARFVQGLGGACSWAGGLAWLIGTAPSDRRGALIGGAMGAAVFGIMLGPVLGSAASEIGPEPVFAGVAVAAALLLVAAATTPAGARGERSSWAQLGAAARRPQLRLAVWIFMLPALFSGTFGVLAPLRLDDLGAGAVTIGAMFLVAASIEMVLNPVLGRVSDRRGRMPPIRAGLAGATVMAILLPIPAVVAVLFAVGVAAVTMLALIWAPAGALLSDASEASGLDQGFAFGLMNLAWAGGQVVGGAAGGGLADLTTDAVPYALLAAVCAATLLAVRAYAPQLGQGAVPRAR
jgi:MFS family permease